MKPILNLWRKLTKYQFKIVKQTDYAGMNEDGYVNETLTYYVCYRSWILPIWRAVGKWRYYGETEWFRLSFSSTKQAQNYIENYLCKGRFPGTCEQEDVMDISC